MSGVVFSLSVAERKRRGSSSRRVGEDETAEVLVRWIVLRRVLSRAVFVSPEAVVQVVVDVVVVVVDRGAGGSATARGCHGRVGDCRVVGCRRGATTATAAWSI